MDQEKIGKFITKCRQEKKITQEELANKIGVTDKAISKWENGRCLPDVSLFKPLCKELNISINELLNGEKTLKNNEEGYINYIDHTNKENKNKITKIILMFIFIITFILLSIYFLNNYGKTTIYKLYGTSENFIYDNGLIIFSPEKNILVTNPITIKSEIKEDNILSMSLINDKKVLVTATLFGNQTYIENTGYNEIFNNQIPTNTNSWYLEIQYIKDNKLSTEKIKLNTTKILSTNIFNPKISQVIGKEGNTTYVNSSKITDKEFNNWLAKKEKLINKGYKEENIYKYTKELKKQSISISIHPKETTINLHTNNAYGEDGINLEYKESLNTKTISIEKINNKIYYSAEYNINENKILCKTNNCNKEIEQNCTNFYKFIKDELS